MNRVEFRPESKAWQVRIQERIRVPKHGGLKQKRGKHNQLADWLQREYGFTRERAETEALK